MTGIIKFLMGLGCMAVLLWLAGLAGFAVHLRGIPPGPAHQSTDAIIVLTGGPDRINTGLDLLAEGKAEYLFISGVNQGVTVDKLIKMWGKSTPDSPAPCCVILGHRARNTAGNATEAGEWARTTGISSARLLTSAYHMPRSWLEFRAVMPDIHIYPHPLPARRTNWGLIASEYTKTIYTFARIRLLSGLK